MNSNNQSTNHQLRTVMYTNVSPMERLRGKGRFNRLQEAQTIQCRHKADELGLHVVDEYLDEYDGDHNFDALVALIGRLHTDGNIETVVVRMSLAVSSCSGTTF